jgi:hypothetical protein
VAHLPIDRRAGITGARAQARALAFGNGIGEPDLQCPRLPGRDKRRSAHRAGSFAVATNGNPVARNNEGVTGSDGPACRHQRCGNDFQRCGQLDKGNVSSDPVAYRGIDVKVRMARDDCEVLERGLPRVVEFNQLAIGARLNAMRCRENEIACQRDARARMCRVSQSA